MLFFAQSTSRRPSPNVTMEPIFRLAYQFLGSLAKCLEPRKKSRVFHVDSSIANFYFRFIWEILTSSQGQDRPIMHIYTFLEPCWMPYKDSRIQIETGRSPNSRVEMPNPGRC